MTAETKESAVTIRPIEAADIAAVRALLVTEQECGNAYVHGALDRLDASAQSQTAECLGVCALAGDQIVGSALFGRVDGTRGTARLFGVVVLEDLRRRGIGHALLGGVVQALTQVHAGRLLADVADDLPVMQSCWSFLGANMFAEEGRIPDYFRDGVALVYLRRDLDTTPQPTR